MNNNCDGPDENSLTAFAKALQGHTKVLSVRRRPSTFLFDLSLSSGNNLVVFTTNLYVVGEADVQEILSEYSDVSCVVTLSAWNKVSLAALNYGQRRKVGVFRWKEFFGALNYRKYWLYEEMAQDLDPETASAERKRRRRNWN